MNEKRRNNVPSIKAAYSVYKSGISKWLPALNASTGQAKESVKGGSREEPATGKKKPGGINRRIVGIVVLIAVLILAWFGVDLLFMPSNEHSVSSVSPSGEIEFEPSQE